jgi:hypothetical protein
VADRRSCPYGASSNQIDGRNAGTSARRSGLLHDTYIEVFTLEIKLDGSESIDIEGFNHQNAIDALIIEEIENNIQCGDKFRIEFEPAFGVSAEIVCRKIEVMDVTLGIPKNSVYKT